MLLVNQKIPEVLVDRQALENLGVPENPGSLEPLEAQGHLFH